MWMRMLRGAAQVCKTPDGRQFKVGSGLSDAQRRDPPAVGRIITYRYQELTAANLPRFPTLVAERPDLDWSTVIADYVPPGPRVDAALKKKHTVLFGDSAQHSGLGAAGAPEAPAEVQRGLKRPLSQVDVMQLGAAEDPGCGADLVEAAVRAAILERGARRTVAAAWLVRRRRLCSRHALHREAQESAAADGMDEDDINDERAGGLRRGAAGGDAPLAGEPRAAAVAAAPPALAAPAVALAAHVARPRVEAEAGIAASSGGTGSDTAARADVIA
ncbi:unnamed protein product [Prorocentrum cordatum]|uniref:DNA ligase OB-like domain-containing protein n=1 Tax=Prorocentrum cordatum TaxID=2364126 RepID=A0ABN9PPT3_9DINO|nr:unnamed protein product [Polarella glacialis]